MCSFHLDEGIWKVDYKFNLWRHRCLHHHGNNKSEVVCNCPFAPVIALDENFFIIKIAPIIRSQQNVYPKVITHTYIYCMPVIFPLPSRKFSAIYRGCFSYMDRVMTVQSLDFLIHYVISALVFNTNDYGLAQDRNILSVLAMGILHSCAKPYNYVQNHWSIMHVCIPSLIMLFKFIFF